MGDVLLTTPAIRAVRKAKPDAAIHVLVKPQFKRMLWGNPNLDLIIEFDGNLRSTLLNLKSESYTFIIDLHGNIRSLVLKKGLGAKSYTFKKLNFEKWLLTAWKIKRLPRVHICQRYLQAAVAIGAKDDGLGMDFYIDAADCSILDSIPFSNKQFIVWAIGGNHATKQLPLDKCMELAALIAFPIVIIGGNEEAESGKNLAALSDNFVNMCGKCNIGQSAMLIQQSAGVITHDTGMMHVAAALDKPIASIWGNTVPEFGMYPYFKKGSEAAKLSRIFQVENLKCRPCSKIGFEQCPKGHFKCMVNQDLPAIAAWAKALITRT